MRLVSSDMETKKPEISYNIDITRTIEDLKKELQSLPLQVYQNLSKEALKFFGIEVVGKPECDPILYKEKDRNGKN